MHFVGNLVLGTFAEERFSAKTGLSPHALLFYVGVFDMTAAEILNAQSLLNSDAVWDWFLLLRRRSWMKGAKCNYPQVLCDFTGFYSPSCLIQTHFSEKSLKNPAEPKQSILIATDLSKREKHININCCSSWLEFKFIFLKVNYRARFWFFFFFSSCNLCCPSKFSLKWTYCLRRFVCLSVKQVCF